jgi:hypothetical protein
MARMQRRAEKKRALSEQILAEGERRNATFGTSKHRVSRIHAFIGKQRRKEARRARAKKDRRNVQAR